MEKSNLRNIITLIFLWLAISIPSLFQRPLLPIDETRYAAVAWEMWVRHDFLVPYLNGFPYSHKPPLLFWLMHLGWWIFGVNDWWPRLIPSLFGLGSLLISRPLAGKIFPGHTGIVDRASFILMGTSIWICLSTFLMFDMILAFFVLIALLGIWQLLEDKKFAGTILLTAGTGLGLLSKGPVAFLHILPSAILAPYWGSGLRKAKWPHFYTYTGIGVVLGILVALSWVIPAAISGGQEYKNAILWGQTAHRIVHSFAHMRPFWWYIPVLPVILYPWSLWPPLWQNIARLSFKEPGVKYCLSILIPAILIFSVVSGKQVYYLLPLVPLFAILMARIVGNSPISRASMVVPVIFILLIGLLWTAAPFFPESFSLPFSLKQTSWLCGVFLLAGSAACLIFHPDNTEQAIKWLALSLIFTFLVFQHGIVNMAGEPYDVRPIAQKIASLEKAGFRIANAGKYHGQYHFYGRLTKSLDIISKGQIKKWLDTHPQGRVIAYFHKWPDSTNAHVEYVHPFRGRMAVILSRE